MTKNAGTNRKKATSKPEYSAPVSPEPPKPLRKVAAVDLPEAVAANRAAILESPSYRLAEYDVDFLRRKENRPLRMQLELLKTETLLREHRSMRRSSSSAARRSCRASRPKPCSKRRG